MTTCPTCHRPYLRPRGRPLSSATMENALCLTRIARGMSRMDLATAIGANETCIQRWERGEAAPNEAQHKALCEVLGDPLEGVRVSRRKRT